MSYYADIEGIIWARSPEAAERVAEIIESGDAWECMKIGNRIDFWTGGRNYHDEDYRELLDTIISEGLSDSFEIDCIGEDNTFWGFFPKEAGSGWVKKRGHIEYDEEIEDDEEEE